MFQMAQCAVGNRTDGDLRLKSKTRNPKSD